MFAGIRSGTHGVLLVGDTGLYTRGKKENDKYIGLAKSNPQQDQYIYYFHFSPVGDVSDSVKGILKPFYCPLPNCFRYGVPSRSATVNTRDGGSSMVCRRRILHSSA